MNLRAQIKRFVPQNWRGLSLAGMAAVTLLSVSSNAQAPDSYYPRPYDARPQAPYPPGGSQGQIPPGQGPDYIVPENDPYLAPQRPMSQREHYCRQLEQRLARDWIDKNRGTEDLPRIEEELRKVRQTHRRLEIRAERKNCYEYFLFSKTVRRTRRCFALNKEIQKARRELSSLEGQYQRITQARRGNNFQRNELISALARNGCGAQYQRAARQNSWGGLFSFFEEDNSRIDRRGRLERHHMPFATYRTMCVRLCDGYYFPVSFSAMQSKFGQDDNACQSKCAAPAKLFVYENPGGSVETMTSVDGIAYSEIPNAWKYRKVFVKGCSCKIADYNPAEIQEFERAEASGGGAPTNSGSAPLRPNIGNNALPQAPRPQKPKPEDRAKATEPTADEIAKKLAQSKGFTTEVTPEKSR